MRIVFLGTPEFAVPALDALARAGHEMLSVVAQPDRPAGRGRALREPATKVWAREHGIPVLQPEKVRDGRLASDLTTLRPDVLVVAAYGRIFGRDLLTLAPFGAVNIHGSLLPRWRGAAPIQWALAEGDRETGVTIMQMDEGLDTGDILLQRVLPISGDATADALRARLAALGAEAIVEALPLLEGGRLTPVRQEPSAVTLARIIEKEDGRLDFSAPAERLAARSAPSPPGQAPSPPSAGGSSKSTRPRRRPDRPTHRPESASPARSGSSRAAAARRSGSSRSSSRESGG